MRYTVFGAMALMRFTVHAGKVFAETQFSALMIKVRAFRAEPL